MLANQTVWDTTARWNVLTERQPTSWGDYEPVLTIDSGDGVCYSTFGVGETGGMIVNT